MSPARDTRWVYGLATVTVGYDVVVVWAVTHGAWVGLAVLGGFVLGMLAASLWTPLTARWISLRPMAVSWSWGLAGLCGALVIGGWVASAWAGWIVLAAVGVGLMVHALTVRSGSEPTG
jgi:hypothetical protein